MTSVRTTLRVRASRGDWLLPLNINKTQMKSSRIEDVFDTFDFLQFFSHNNLHQRNSVRSPVMWRCEVSWQWSMSLKSRSWL